ncbi:hypothetical protein LZ012_14075 [Dechloromonas sp. XY25]|uniref:DUF1444 family protein n=1 Tax=Dechloromonas hankyongensis TaxID=2908002 RepID=A0ABS9K4N6_9RHOO|nr:hypothetical protein [Dechloromonas hankyongensis]MCG2578118.1 hypothetical protein [Dechloromonas hankyongensis]
MFGLFRKRKEEAQPVAAASPSTDHDKDVLERIVPMIKVVEHQGTGLQHIELPEGDSPISNVFAGDLIVMYAEDLPDRFAYLSKKRMRELGLNMDELHALAIQNLPNRIPEIQLHGSAPRFMLTAGGNFEATLLLHPTLWDSLAEHLPGTPMAVVPSRDLLFVTCLEWEEGPAFMKEMAEKELEDNRYALSKLVFVRHNNSWIVDSFHS